MGWNLWEECTINSFSCCVRAMHVDATNQSDEIESSSGFRWPNSSEIDFRNSKHGPNSSDKLGSCILKRTRTQFAGVRSSHIGPLLGDLKIESVAIGARWVRNGVPNRCTWLRQVISEFNLCYETCTCKMRPLAVLMRLVCCGGAGANRIIMSFRLLRPI